MPAVEMAKFRLSKDVVAVGTGGVSGGGGIDLGTVESEAIIKVPDVVRELCRRLPLSRATIVRILKGCDRVEDVRANPAVFIDQVADCLNRALYSELTEQIEYTPSGDSFSASMFRDRHQDATVAPRVVSVEHSVADLVVCDSEVEQKFAIFLDCRTDVPFFLKMPEWYKIPTPLGNYNLDWAFIWDKAGERRFYLVRETKGASTSRSFSGSRTHGCRPRRGGSEGHRAAQRPWSRSCSRMPGWSRHPTRLGVVGLPRRSCRRRGGVRSAPAEP
jgi:type III restriction enzyme